MGVFSASNGGIATIKRGIATIKGGIATIKGGIAREIPVLFSKKDCNCRTIVKLQVQQIRGLFCNSLTISIKKFTFCTIIKLQLPYPNPGPVLQLPYPYLKKMPYGLIAIGALC